jgi:hypothetical protein
VDERLSFFKDKEYEEMDWLNLAIEEPVFSLNDILVSMPDEVEVTPEFIENLDWHTIDKSDLLKYAVDNAKTWSKYRYSLVRAYEFKMTEDEVVTFNFETGVLSHPISLVKTTKLFEGEELMDIVAGMACKVIQEGLGSYYNIDNKRANEILDLINPNSKVRSTRSASRKISGLKQELKAVILQDKWRIRNLDIFIKAAEWITEYIKSGNLAAITNFNKLKVMTRINGGAPIYSMEEVK